MKVVCNASPLITLAKTGLIDVLHSLFDRVVVPQAVVKEVMAGGSEDPGCLAVSQLPWLEHVVLDPKSSVEAGSIGMMMFVSAKSFMSGRE